MLEKHSRARLLQKSTSCLIGSEAIAANDKLQVIRSKTSPSSPAKNISRTSSLRQKFAKVMPFSFRDKNSNTVKNNKECNKDLVTYLTSAALCASGPVLPTEGKVKFYKTILRPLEVPK